MVTDRELKSLRKKIDIERAKIRLGQQKRDLILQESRMRRELFLLQNPRKTEFGKRIGRGLKITGRKVGGALIKQGRLISQQQERDRRLDEARRVRERRPIKVRKIKRTSRGDFGPDIFAGLDF